MTASVVRVLVIAAAAAAVAVAALERVHDDKPRTTHVRFVFSTDVKQLLLPLIKQFNREHDVQVDPVPLTSGEAEQAIASRRERAVLWTPASSSLWGRLLDHDAHADWVRA